MRVIIADDTLKSQMHAYLTLRARHLCEIAEDRETVLKLVHDYEPDVILLSLRFDSDDDNNGEWVTLVNELHKSKTKLRLIGICNSDDAQLEAKAKEIGLCDIIYRPIRRQKLLEMIM